MRNKIPAERFVRICSKSRPSALQYSCFLLRGLSQENLHFVMLVVTETHMAVDSSFLRTKCHPKIEFQYLWRQSGVVWLYWGRERDLRFPQFPSVKRGAGAEGLSGCAGQVPEECVWSRTWSSAVFSVTNKPALTSPRCPQISCISSQELFKLGCVENFEVFFIMCFTGETWEKRRKWIPSSFAFKSLA